MTTPGPLREVLTIQENAPDPVAVVSLTRTTTIATVATRRPHGYTTGDFVMMVGAAPEGYTGKKKITVTGASSFTYPVVSTLTTPAAGVITVVYVSDAQGGRKIGWATFRVLHAEAIPVKAWEKLQVQALQGQLDYRFRIHAVDSAGLTNAMRILWTPQWPPGAPLHTLEISGVLADGDGRQWALVECGEAA